jgi:hypothetical protein
MTRTNSKTPEQRKAEREAVLATLGEKVAALASSTEWIAYLRFVAAFRRYSFNNLIGYDAGTVISFSSRCVVVEVKSQT